MSKHHKKSHKKNTHTTKKHHKKKKSISKKRRKKKQSKRSIAMKLGVAILLSSIFYMVLFFIFFSIGKMDGYSMLPTIGNKQVVAISRNRRIKRFDIVFLKTPGNGKGHSIRRVIGMPGDEVTFKQDELYINGEGKEEKYLVAKKKALKEMILTDDFKLEDVTGHKTVPKDSYFLLGDNRKSSTDSRYYGNVSKKNIIGKVEIRLFPFSKFKVF
ncbi:MAG: signal peptidase I [Vagococcus sp.]